MFSIPGPAGALQAKLTGFDAAAEAIAILCHPHPLYGGSMDDLVLTAVAEALAAQHVAIVRFNFRGVGASAGSHSGQGGEVDDLRAVLNWLSMSIQTSASSSPVTPSAPALSPGSCAQSRLISHACCWLLHLWATCPYRFRTAPYQ
jgi:alpha/beta superfamily hydrolase